MIFLILSNSKFKRADYLLPAYPFLAIWLSINLQSLYLQKSVPVQVWMRWGLATIVLSSIFGWWYYETVLSIRQEAVREQKPFAQAIRALAPAPEPIVFFRVENHLLAFHLGRPIHTLVEWGDLQTYLAKSNKVFLVTRSEFVEEIQQQIQPCQLEVLITSELLSRAKPERPLSFLRKSSSP